jgi:hypothetical protein
VQALVRRNANNVQRMPVIHKDLEQDHLVRPRLVAAQKAPPPAKSDRGTKGGLTQ